MQSTSLTVRPLTPHIGAEVDGVDLSRPLADEQLAELRRAFLAWSVLVFREQRLDREQHKAFAARFGPLHVHPLQAAPGYEGGDDPAILVVETTERSRYAAGDGWHTDVSCDEKPPMGSMLYVTRVPASGGGDTLFADMYRAYELEAPRL